MKSPKTERRYPVKTEGPGKPPNYDRAVKNLTDQELADEIRLGRGDLGFQAALQAEKLRRVTRA